MRNKVFIRKNIFITLSCISVGSLFCAFAAPLESFEIYKQTELNQFNQSYSKVFILSENDTSKPYGLNISKAEKLAGIYQDAKIQKILLLVVAAAASSAAIMLNEIVEDLENYNEVTEIEFKSKKQLWIEKIKHKYAMMSLAQRELFKEEIKALLELSGGDSTFEASELNATDKFLNCNYLIAEGHDLDSAIAMTWGVEKGSEEFENIKLKFNDWLVS